MLDSLILKSISLPMKSMSRDDGNMSRVFIGAGAGGLLGGVAGSRVSGEDVDNAMNRRNAMIGALAGAAIGAGLVAATKGIRS